ncbi:hypothetical protein BE20_14705 [Sorangium cellulosum]|nr:hypothetical protein BE20_14705 [Sorangium cellulosum]
MSSSWSARAEGASGPRRLVRTRCFAPRCAKSRATCAPSAPVPPVTRTVPRGARGRGASPRGARTRRRAKSPSGRRASSSSPASAPPSAATRWSIAAVSSAPDAPSLDARSTAPPRRSGCSSDTTRASPHVAACAGLTIASARETETAPREKSHTRASSAASPSACTSVSVRASPAGTAGCDVEGPSSSPTNESTPRSAPRPATASRSRAASSARAHASAPRPNVTTSPPRPSSARTTLSTTPSHAPAARTTSHVPEASPRDVAAIGLHATR